MIQDLFLRWIVTALFVFGAAECVFAITVGHREWKPIVGNLLHLVMAVAMAVMAWPRGAELPTTGPTVFFLLATLWFVGLLLVDSTHRAANAYHALMMLAMAWMYAVMSGSLLPVPADGSTGGHGVSSMPGMPGMILPDTGDPAAGAAAPPFVTGLNWLCAVGFAIAAVWWLYRYFVERKGDPTQPALRFLGAASQVMMAAGMAVMFGVML